MPKLGPFVTVCVPSKECRTDLTWRSSSVGDSYLKGQPENTLTNGGGQGWGHKLILTPGKEDSKFCWRFLLLFTDQWGHSSAWVFRTHLPVTSGFILEARGKARRKKSCRVTRTLEQEQPSLRKLQMNSPAVLFMQPAGGPTPPRKTKTWLDLELGT